MSSLDTPVLEQDPHSALIFALAAESLAAYYEQRWPRSLGQDSGVS